MNTVTHEQDAVTPETEPGQIFINGESVWMVTEKHCLVNLRSGQLLKWPSDDGRNASLVGDTLVTGPITITPDP